MVVQSQVNGSTALTVIRILTSTYGLLKTFGNKLSEDVKPLNKQRSNLNLKQSRSESCAESNYAIEIPKIQILRKNSTRFLLNKFYLRRPFFHYNKK
ncbi:1647_t:CDS:2 [Funneliformis mosseae]|uniref:1647_t:CDS:1 n=1 Tax=Funneliformis mosseae TaxID=27381 RepID=A0A9N9BKR3_FUNMO|nr:1647_t:CDS:2 [Funneliformis mosseae]